MPKATPPHRIVTLVIAGEDPMRWFAEFVNAMEEHEERALLDALPEALPLLRVCREIEAEQAA